MSAPQPTRFRVVAAWVALFAGFILGTSCTPERPPATTRAPPAPDVDPPAADWPELLVRAHGRCVNYVHALKDGALVDAASSLAGIASDATPTWPEESILDEVLGSGDRCRLELFAFCDQACEGRCGDCDGTGQCSACDVKGVCPRCNGVAFREDPCDACACKDCDRSGLCPACKGERKMTCERCRGAGRGAPIEEKTTCPDCGGAGRIKPRRASARSLGRLCKRCGGDGTVERTAPRNCPDCEGHGNLHCVPCGGNGKCKICLGLGRRMRCSICKGSGVANFTCPVCGGAGTCAACEGSGDHPACAGSGACVACQGTARIALYSFPVKRSWLSLDPGLVYLSAMDVTVDGRSPPARTVNRHEVHHVRGTGEVTVAHGSLKTELPLGPDVLYCLTDDRGPFWVTKVVLEPRTR